MEDVFGPPLGRVQGQRSKVKGQGSMSPGTKNGIFGPLGGLRVRFMFGKTSLSSNLFSCISIYSYFNSEYRFSEPHSAWKYIWKYFMTVAAGG